MQHGSAASEIRAEVSARSAQRGRDAPRQLSVAAAAWSTDIEIASRCAEDTDHGDVGSGEVHALIGSGESRSSGDRYGLRNVEDRRRTVG